MGMHRVLTLVAIGLSTVLIGPSPNATGQKPLEPVAAPTATVEVRFAAGSVVMMTLLQDKIEVQTDYGTLVVPQKDLRHIEFGCALRTKIVARSTMPCAD